MDIDALRPGGSVELGGNPVVCLLVLIGWFRSSLCHPVFSCVIKHGLLTQILILTFCLPTDAGSYFIPPCASHRGISHHA